MALADYPAYPYYWGYPGYIGAGVIATGIVFGAGYALGRWTSGRYWAAVAIGAAARSTGTPEGINVNRGGAGFANWQHNPAHRGGAQYNKTQTSSRNSAMPIADRVVVGLPGAGQGANRPDIGNRGGAAKAGIGAAGIGAAGKAAAGKGAAGKAAAGKAAAGKAAAGNRGAAKRALAQAG